MVGESSNSEDHDCAGEPTGLHDGVREAENSGADYGDKYIGERLWLGRERISLVAEEWGVFSGSDWYGIGRK